MVDMTMYKYTTIYPERLNGAAVLVRCKVAKVWGVVVVLPPTVGTTKLTDDSSTLGHAVELSIEEQTMAAKQVEAQLIPES